MINKGENTTFGIPFDHKTKETRKLDNDYHISTYHLYFLRFS